MKSLAYLFFTNIKNYFKDLKNSPSKIVLYVVVIALLGLSIYSRTQINYEANEIRDISEVYGMIFALYASVFIMICSKGFSSGSSFYSMADVNMLFTLPISSKKILFYGLIKQMGTSMLVGLFLLFQYGWLGSTYNLEFISIIYILIGYGIVMFSAQVTSMAIYSFTSSNVKMQNIVKGIIYTICGLIILFLLIPIIKTGEINLAILVERVNDNIIDYVPIVGWVKAFTVGLILNKYLTAIIFLIITLGYNVILVFLILKSKGDYYEDVLKATEVSFSAITAKKEGNAQNAVPTNVKLGKTGLDKGKGANVFFYKHLIESRRAKVFILDKISLIMILFSIGYSYIVKDSGIYSVFMFTTYLQFITIMTSGRWARELTLPYVYMIPISPFKKLIVLVMESIYKSVIEACVLFVPVGIILNASIVEIIVLIIARVSLGLIFISGNFLVDRIFGTISSKAIIIGVYLVCIIILVIPGIALGIYLSFIVSASIIPSTISVFLGVIIGSIIVSGIVTYLCKDILSYPELNSR